MKKTEEQVVESEVTETVETVVSEEKTEKKSRSAKNTKKSAQRPSRKEKDNRFEERVVAINRISKTVKGGSAVTKTNDYSQDEYALSIVNKLLEETAPVFQRVIGTATMDVDRYGAADWAATALKDYANADIGVINSGGIRAQAFPILKGSAITVAKIHEIMPFDNVLKTVELKGSDVKTLVNTFVFSNNVVRDNATGDVYINGDKVEDDKYYLVASIDYIFDNHQYPFFKGENPVNTGVLFRDILIDRVEKDQSIILVNR